MDSVRLTVALASAADTERAIRYALEHEESPLDLASGWAAYRNAVGLRKALETWIEMRAERRAQYVTPCGA